MKIQHYIVLTAAIICMSACGYEAPEAVYMTEEQVQETIADGVFYHINDFLDKYMSEEGNYLSDTTLYRTRATKGDGIYLFSIDTIPSTGPAIYIRGRVTTDDYGGNFYKSMVIQEVVNGEQQNLRLSIDMGSASGMYPRGQEILIRCNGLAIGRYANQPQLCVPSYNNNTNAQNSEQKVGWAPGRIPAPICKTHFLRVGQTDATKLHYDTLTIAECIANYSDIVAARKVDGKLVVVKDIWFDGKYNDNNNGPTLCNFYNPETNSGNPTTDGNSAVFGPTTGNLGYPQSRCITDGSKWTLVSTSEYAKYAHYYLPYERVNDAVIYGTYKGTVRGILGYYMDNANYAPDQAKWSITICDLGDLDLKATGDGNLPEGTQWEPEEWVQ